MISTEQARVIYELYKERGVRYEWFAPDYVYPKELDQPARAALAELVAAKLVEQEGQNMRLTHVALRSYDEWALYPKTSKLRKVIFRSALGGTCSTMITVTGQIEVIKLEQILREDPEYVGMEMV